MSRKKGAEIVGNTYGEILNPLELVIAEQVLTKQSDDRFAALDEVLYENLDKIETYDQFKKFIFGYVGFVRKTTINTDGVLNPLLKKIESWAKMAYSDNEEKKDQLIGYVKMIQDDIFKDWERGHFGNKDIGSGINGPIAESSKYILDVFVGNSNK